MSQELAGKLVLITGVGIKPVQHIFEDITTGETTHTPVTVDGQEYKANIGAATAMECAKAGADLIMVSRNSRALKDIASWIHEQIQHNSSSIRPVGYDLNPECFNPPYFRNLISWNRSTPAQQTLYWVNSIGVGGGTVKLKNDNPYLTLDEMDHSSLEAELSVIKTSAGVLKSLLPIFRQQSETRVAMVSSMTAIRGYWAGSVHAAAKGGLSRFTNAAMLELASDRIYITDVRPGGVDTGLYDSEIVRNRVTDMCHRSYGSGWSLMPPSAVGKMIVTVLSSEAHIPSVNMLARGQMPHEGS
jgi:short-subunit dehydrogenase